MVHFSLLTDGIVGVGSWEGHLPVFSEGRGTEPGTKDEWDQPDFVLLQESGTRKEKEGWGWGGGRL